MIKRTVKKLLPHSVNLYLENLRYFLQGGSMVSKWEKDGKPIPPPHIIKQRAIAKCSREFNLKYFVETGTFRGQMVMAQQKNFDQLYSIEIDDFLFKQAKKAFIRFNHIEILKGDSEEVLGKLVPYLKEPALFWLDAHYSGGITSMGEFECPIYSELEHIFQNNGIKHTILIDDARCFNGTHDYPMMQELESFVKEKTYGYKQICIKDDIIYILPENSNI